MIARTCGRKTTEKRDLEDSKAVRRANTVEEEKLEIEIADRTISDLRRDASCP